jgi:hypothetical protein
MLLPVMLLLSVARNSGNRSTYSTSSSSSTSSTRSNAYAVYTMSMLLVAYMGIALALCTTMILDFIYTYIMHILLPICTVTCTQCSAEDLIVLTVCTVTCMECGTEDFTYTHSIQHVYSAVSTLKH